MGKRKEKSGNPKTLDLVGEDDGDEITGREGKGFFACYLLTSLSPRHKGHTYIGFTVNPRRRIRQHNGEIRCGAWRTKSRRPWEMVLCIYGFPTNIGALQFEWAWQHPMESLAVRQAAAAFKSFSGVTNKIKLAYTMLNLPTWQRLNITVNYFSTKYMCHGALCPSLPEHMKVRICSMDELACYIRQDGCVSENEDSLDAEEQHQEENEAIIPRIPENGFDATSNYFANDLNAVDEICNDQTGTIHNSLDQVPSFCTNEVVGDGKLSGTICNCVAELEKRKRTELSVALNLDEDQQHGSMGKRSRNAAAATKDPSRQCLRMSGLVHKHIAELENRKEAEFSCGSNLDEDKQSDLMEKQSRNAAAAAKDASRRSFRMSDGVEIIDLATPSPSCRVVGGSCGKKKRVPEIIDLTRSPNFIQL